MRLGPVLGASGDPLNPIGEEPTAHVTRVEPDAWATDTRYMVLCHVCGRLRQAEPLVDASDARGVARRHTSYHEKYGD